MKRGAAALLVLGLGLLFFLPFANRALFVDDHAHYQEALEIISHPGSPYASASAKMKWPQGGSPLEANPPLYFYAVGALSKLTGDDPLRIHLGLLPLHLAGLLAFYFFSKKIVAHPLLATLLWLTTPHFWLTTNSLLLDSFLAPLMMIGLVFFTTGWDEGNDLYTGIGSIFLTLVPLVKYTGLLAWASALLWVFLVSKKIKTRRWIFLAIPVFLFGGWLVWSRHLYLTPHLLAVAHSSMVFPSLLQIFSVMAFSSGTTWILAVPLVMLLFGKVRSHVGVYLLFFLGSLAGGIALFGGMPDRIQVGLQFGCWLGIFFSWLFYVARRRDPVNNFLGLWILLGLGGLSVARGWICGRYLVIVGPALVLLTLRVLEENIPQENFSVRWLGLWCGPMVVASLLLAIADYQQAGIDRTAARAFNDEIKNKNPKKMACYPSALLSGLDYYLDRTKWRAAEPGEKLETGELVLLPWRGLPVGFLPPLLNGKVVSQKPYFISLPMRTLDSLSRAGYYGSVWGPLPFSFSRAPAEVYTLFEVGD